MYTIYTVRYGDTLDSIANMYGTTKEELKKLNSFNLDNISMGNQIVVPSNNSEFLKTYIIIVGDTLYITKDGDTMSKILDINNITFEELIQRNKNIYLEPDQIIILKD